MARSVYGIPYTDFFTTRDQVLSYLIQKGYKNVEENNEHVWKKGDGFWTAIEYIKLEFDNNSTIIVSGWIRSILSGEKNLEGFYGIIPKKEVLGDIQMINCLVK